MFLCGRGSATLEHPFTAADICILRRSASVYAFDAFLPFLWQYPLFQVTSDALKELPSDTTATTSLHTFEQNCLYRLATMPEDLDKRMKTLKLRYQGDLDRSIRYILQPFQAVQCVYTIHQHITTSHLEQLATTSCSEQMSRKISILKTIEYLASTESISAGGIPNPVSINHTTLAPSMTTLWNICEDSNNEKNDT